MRSKSWKSVAIALVLVLSMSGCWQKSPDFEAFRSVSAVMTKEAMKHHFGDHFYFDSSPYGDEGYIVTLLGTENKRMWEVSVESDPIFFVDTEGRVFAVNEAAAESSMDGVPMAAAPIQEFVHTLHDGVSEAIEKVRRRSAEEEGSSK